jgi:hypothetical protein
MVFLESSAAGLHYSISPRKDDVLFEVSNFDDQFVADLT